MLGLRRGSAAKVDCGALELRFALEIPDIARGRHRSKIEEVRRSHRHTVTYCNEQPNGGVCLPYALGLIGEQAYEDIAIVAEVLALPGVFLGTDFANWLLGGRLIEMDQEREGALVLYFKYDVWTHAGRVVQPGRVQSKWGTFPVYQHGTWEVPCRYGDWVRYFEMPPRSLFQEYAASTRGIRL
jgi:hypothetical protein